jgi:hypothetical protein
MRIIWTTTVCLILISCSDQTDKVINNDNQIVWMKSEFNPDHAHEYLSEVELQINRISCLK